jgi:hypothetical protein
MRGSCGTVLAADGQVTDRAWDGHLSSVALFAPKAIARPHIAIETDAKQRRAPDCEKIIILTITSIGSTGIRYARRTWLIPESLAIDLFDERSMRRQVMNVTARLVSSESPQGVKGTCKTSPINFARRPVQST